MCVCVDWLVHFVGVYYWSSIPAFSPGDELDLTPKTMELMFVPSYRRHTVMQGMCVVIGRVGADGEGGVSDGRGESVIGGWNQ